MYLLLARLAWTDHGVSSRFCFALLDRVERLATPCICSGDVLILLANEKILQSELPDGTPQIQRPLLTKEWILMLWKIWEVPQVRGAVGALIKWPAFTREYSVAGRPGTQRSKCRSPYGHPTQTRLIKLTVESNHRAVRGFKSQETWSQRKRSPVAAAALPSRATSMPFPGHTLHSVSVLLEWNEPLHHIWVCKLKTNSVGISVFSLCCKQWHMHRKSCLRPTYSRLTAPCLAESPLVHPKQMQMMKTH